jgi:hypothetical protein
MGNQWRLGCRCPPTQRCLLFLMYQHVATQELLAASAHASLEATLKSRWLPIS